MANNGHKIKRAPRTVQKASSTLLIVDDRPVQLDGVRAALERHIPDWNVICTAGEADTLAKLKSLGSLVPNLVSVDLGIDSDPDGPSYGLRLLAKLRQQRGLRLAVHSAQPVRVEVVQQLIGIPASYIRIHDSDAVDIFAKMIPFLAAGYLVYSPNVASRFPEAILNSPDALDSTQWRTLALLSEQPVLTYEQIATRERITVGALNQRIRKIVDRLSSVGFCIPDRGSSDQKNRRALTEYYLVNHTRYRR